MKLTAGDDFEVGSPWAARSFFRRPLYLYYGYSLTRYILKIDRFFIDPLIMKKN
jgi:hypothetical protein